MRSLENKLVARAECSTKQVEDDPSASGFGAKSGIVPEEQQTCRPGLRVEQQLSAGLPMRSLENKLVARAECSTKQVEEGDTCAALATKV
jgi:hypothetical protein